jgi:hypothetical protein
MKNALPGSHVVNDSEDAGIYGAQVVGNHQTLKAVLNRVKPGLSEENTSGTIRDEYCRGRAGVYYLDQGKR